MEQNWLEERERDRQSKLVHIVVLQLTLDLNYVVSRDQTSPGSSRD